MIRRIGHYEVVEKIGEGAMGVVYKAQDPRRFNRIVAIKTIKDRQDKSAVEQFIKEAEVLTKLYHPNLIKIDDVGEFEEDSIKKPYLVMEFLFGKTLQEIIKRKEELSVDRKLYIIIQACRGLHAAHEAGLIHRDIKPSNIFVLEEDFVKIIDFGIARESSAEMTLAWKGTPYYMSPEQIELKVAPSRRSDIFSLGVVFYELLTYRKPYSGKSTQEIFSSILNFNPKPIKEIDPSIDDQVCKIVEKALARDPRKRFNTTREIADLIEKIRRGEYIEIFDVEKIQTRITKAKKAAEEGNFPVAEIILQDLQSEGFYLREIDQLEESIERLKDEHRISQLMKTATDLIKEEEYELALKRLNEIIGINENNKPALELIAEVKRKIQEQEIRGWLRRAKDEMDKNNFTNAAESINKALQVDPNNKDAKALLSYLEEAKKLRAVKNRLFAESKRSFEEGDVNKAFGKIQELIGLDAKNAEYINFYNKVNAEKTNIETKLMEGKDLLERKRFNDAIVLARSILDKYKNQPQFEALIEEAKRKQEEERLNDIAYILAAAEKESSIEKKILILTEGLKKYPGEKELSKKANEAVERKRQIEALLKEVDELEKRNQFVDAISRLEKVIPISGEKEEALRARREGLERKLIELKEREFKRERIEIANEHLRSRNFDKARQVVMKALETLPKDRDLEALLKTIEERIKRENEAAQLKTIGRERLRAGRYTDAIKLFDEALKISSSDEEIIRLRDEAKKQKEHADRIKLVNNLFKQAQDLIEGRNIALAEQIVEHILKLDPQNPDVKILVDTIDSHKKEEAKEKYVNEKLSEAAFLAKKGDYNTAEKVLEEAAAAYPDLRVRSFLEEVRKEREIVELKAYKAQTLQRLNQLIESKKYSEAKGLALEALIRCPEDRELVAKLMLIEQEIKEEAARREREKFIGERIVQAQELVNKNELEEAISLLRQALNTYPGDPTLLEYLRKLETRKETIERDIKEAVSEVEGLCREKRFTEAKAFLKKTSSQYPTRPELKGLRSNVEAAEAQFINEVTKRVKDLVLTGKSRQAMDDIEAMIASHPNEAWLKELKKEARTKWLTLTKEEIDKLRSAGRPEAAQKLIEETVTIYPDDPDLRSIQQQLQEDIERQRLEKEKRKQQEEAKLREFKREQRAIASEYSRNREFDKARQVVVKALETLPKDKDLEALLKAIEEKIQRENEAAQLKAAGRERLKAGRYTDAVNLFDEALKLSPSDEETIRLREEAKRQKEHADRLKLINNLLKQAQDLIESKKVALAEPIVEHLLKLDPQNPDVKVLVDTISSHKKEEAKEKYVNEKLAEATFLAKRGNYGAAEKVLEEAAAACPDARITSLLEELKREKEIAEINAYKVQTLQRLDRLVEIKKYSEAKGLALEALTRCSEDKELADKLSIIEQRIKEEVARREREKFVEERVVQAQELVSKNEIDGAIFLIRQALNSYPDDQTLREYVRELETKKEAAERGIKEAMLKAEGLWRDKRFTEAKAFLKKVSSQYPTRRELKDLLNDVEAAEAQFINETTKQVKNLILMGKPREAMDDLEEMIISHPNEAWLKELKKEARTKWLALTKEEINRLRLEEKREEAQKLLEATITNYPDDPDLRTIQQQIKEDINRQRQREREQRRQRIRYKLVSTIRDVGKWAALAVVIGILAGVGIRYFLPRPPKVIKPPEQISKATITIEVKAGGAKVSGATVSIDGVETKEGASGLFKTEVEIGKKHKLQVTKKDYAPYKNEAWELKPGDPSTVSIGLEKIKPETAILYITSNRPEFQLTVNKDNKIIKEESVRDRNTTLRDLDPGKYIITATKPKYKEDTRPILLRAGGSESVSLTLTPNPAFVSIIATNAENGQPLKAKIRIEGRDKGETVNGRKDNIEVPAEKNLSIVIECNGFDIYSRDIPALTPEQNKTHEARLNPIKPLYATLMLTVPQNGSGAKVFIDNRPEPIGTLDSQGKFVTKNIPEGEHEFTIKKEGYKDYNIKQYFKAGDSISLPLILEMLKGQVVFNIRPLGAKKTFVRRSDKQTFTFESDERPQLEPGIYDGKVEKDGYEPEGIKDFRVEAGKPSTLSKKLHTIPEFVYRNLSQFENPPARWRNAAIGLLEINGPGRSLLKGDNNYQKYTMAFEFKIDGGALNWIIHAQDGNNYYRFQLDKDKKELRRYIVNGGRPVLAGSKPLAKTVENGKWYRMVIRVDSHKITCEETNHKLLRDTWEDPNRSYDSGNVGFISEPGDSTTIANFLIERPK